MKHIYFDNIRGYGEDSFTHFIPDLARKSCRSAWLFAREHGHPLNQHVHIDIPSNISQEGRKTAYRWYRNKLRSYARDNGFMCVMVLVRACDPETDENPTIDILVHVPDGKHIHFKRTVENWRCDPKVRTVDYSESIDAKSVKRSAFNDLFCATSRQFGLSHPELPRKLSGDVMGQRTFYSRHLWTKKQIEFRQSKDLPF